MNEKLIELAKAAGFETRGNTAHIADEKNGLPCVLECTAELAKFDELVREDERKSKWLSIETCPSGVTVLVLTSSGICEAELFRGHLWNMAVGFHDEVPLYWMHKPAPPKEGEAQDA